MAAIESSKDIIATTSITHASTMTHIGLKNPTNDRPTVDTSQYVTM